tara:strand:- start:1780 stop:2136 length:357 start_codon:yes stop_codon:yes gene_type:complete
MNSYRELQERKPRFNTAFTFAFEMNHWFEDDDKLLHGAQIRAAILYRLNDLSDDELEQACLSDTFDTMEESVKGSTWILEPNKHAMHVINEDKMKPWPEDSPSHLPNGVDRRLHVLVP